MVLDQNRVLIVSHDVVGERMAGPGIRYYHLARILSEEFRVALAVPGDVTGLEPRTFDLLCYHDGSNDVIAKAIRRSDVVVIPALWITSIIDHLTPSIHVVVDGYDPFVAESLALGMGDVAEQQSVLTQAYLLGDFFLCASERQRDWLLGLLEANGRVNSYVFNDDPSFRRLVDVVPFGLPERSPERSGRVLKGVWPGIDVDDAVILWGGGLWPWLDPLTAIRAVAEVSQERRDVRLVFPGTEHPNPRMQGIATGNEEARELARQMGLLNRAVFFGDWVPFEDWPTVLLESDIALTLHYDTLETRLAFRSRVLDYIWAGLPTVATRGDATSDLIADHDLGAVVDYEDVDGVADAMLRLLEIAPGTHDARFTQAQEALTWQKASQPLVEFCQSPHRAPDKVALGDDLGSPYYMSLNRHLSRERDRLQELVRNYEQGRFIRVMRWLDRAARTLRGEA